MFALAAALLVAAPGAASGATSHTVRTVRVAVSSKHVWSGTGLTLAIGDAVTVRASGRIHFGAPPINALSPAGIPRAAQCQSIGGPPSAGWPAPLLDCWSLIARIGTSAPVRIGNARTFRATHKGELSLGINDNQLADNSGAWSATVTITPAGATAGAPAAKSHTKSGSSFALYPIIGLIAILLLLLLALLWRRRATEVAAAHNAPWIRPAPETVPTVVAAAPPVWPAPRPQTVLPAEVPIEIDSTVGNVLDVDFTDDGHLLVEYNHFPEGTAVLCAVTRDDLPAGTGEFTADGGGEARHSVVIALVGARAGAGASDVKFTWAVGGVPFQYAVRREMSS
jgi:hypothetical protein